MGYTFLSSLLPTELHHFLQLLLVQPNILKVSHFKQLFTSPTPIHGHPSPPLLIFHCCTLRMIIKLRKHTLPLASVLLPTGNKSPLESVTKVQIWHLASLCCIWCWTHAIGWFCCSIHGDFLRGVANQQIKGASRRWCCVVVMMLGGA